jgi:hypothetical protein
VGRKLRTVKGWLSWRNDNAAHLVLLLNGGVALLAGFAVAAQWQSSIGWGLAIAAAAFGRDPQSVRRPGQTREKTSLAMLARRKLSVSYF